ncbi:MAG: flavin reductase family protein [Ardenticatenales bacterium]|jgi:flavin reductase (DIM6/NTAB) family NADH-FMN oxidoreductase RutF|nr:flavin reductase family protein [Ardenticatenales bacterium]
MHIAIDPTALDPADTHKLTIGTIVPRPIAWTTSVDGEGRVNLAPFSYFMACHSYLPAVAVSIGSRAGKPKDTRANILATGEFVVNIATAALVDAVNVSAADFPHDISELDVLGLETMPSVKVRPPRVAASPIHIECVVLHALTLGEEPRASTLFVGRIVQWHIRSDLLDDGYRVDQAKIEALARMGGPFYTVARDPFARQIPPWESVVGPR